MGSLAAAVVVGLTLASPPVAPAQDVVAEPAVAVAAAENGLSATAASHPRKPPTRRRHRQIGDASCDGEPVARPTIELDLTTRRFQLGVPFYICIKGFADSGSIELVITRPNATEQRATVRPDPVFGVQSYLFLAYPPDPVGLYRVVATQGSRTATKTFTVSPAPTRPRFETLLFSVRPGGSIPFVLAGFAPRETVAMYRYRRTGYNARTGQATFRRERRPATWMRADQQGFALGRLTMRRRGEYLLSAGGLFAGVPVRVR